MFLVFIHEIVVGITFLNGIWIRIGLYPGGETWSLFLLQMYSLFPNSYIFWFFPFILLFVCVIGSYFIGGWLGLVSIAFGFLGGFLISRFFGMILLIVGLFLGLFAPLRD